MIRRVRITEAGAQQGQSHSGMLAEDGCHFELMFQEDSGLRYACLSYSLSGSEESERPCWELPCGDAPRAKN